MTQSIDTHHDAMTIANYIIKYSNEKGYIVDNLRLQKLLYFLQCYSLSQKDALIFKDSIKKWPYGPVIAEVYDNFKSYGPNPISSPEKEYVQIVNDGNNYSVEIKKYNESSITELEKITINIVIENLQKLDTFRLVNITHKEPSWKKYKQVILSGEKNLEYTIDELKQQFGKSGGN